VSQGSTSPVSALANELGVRVQIHTQPGAKKTELMGLHGNAIKVRVHAPPVDGKANEELIRFLAETCGVSRSQVELVSGATGRSKSFVLRGLSVDQATKALLHQTAGRSAPK
jgi:uncharacterized protein